MVLMILLSLPCVFGYNIWSAIQPLGEGSTILDLEDFLVSNILLPVGSLIYLIFCVQTWLGLEQLHQGSKYRFRYKNAAMGKTILSYIHSAYTYNNHFPSGNI